MLRFFKGLLGGKKVKEPAAEAPYKVETPVVEDLADIAIAQREVPVAKPKKPAGARKAAASAKAADKAVKPKAPAKPRAKKAAK